MVLREANGLAGSRGSIEGSTRNHADQAKQGRRAASCHADQAHDATIRPAVDHRGAEAIDRRSKVGEKLLHSVAGCSIQPVRTADQRNGSTFDRTWSKRSFELRGIGDASDASRRRHGGRIATRVPNRPPVATIRALDSGSPSSSVHPVVGVALGDRATIKIGRAIDNDLELDDIRVSRHHAELRRAGTGALEIVDLDSHNGTFVNGRRVQRQAVTDGDYIGVGGQTLHLVNGELRVASARDTAWFGAIDLVVTAGGHRILDEVGFALEPSSVLAVVGTSGSGKSTLLNALTGFRPADSGSVVFGGRDLYAAYDDLRSRMGLVPQADILHTQLTVRQALSYEAELRFPTDVSREKRTARVDEVIAELHLTERANVRIDRLSGGQRKRVSVASELLTQPTLLFLDEPTSGLDPGNEADLMTLLRDLARAGRTVVVVTHSVQSLDLCDRVVVMAPGGRLGFYGPPQEALRYFGEVAGAKTYADIFHQLEERKDIDWKARFRADTAYGEYVRDPLGSPDLEAIPRRPNIDPPPAPTPVGHQLWVLVRRYLAVIRADRGFLLALALQAPIFGLLFSLMYTTNVMTTNDALNSMVRAHLKCPSGQAVNP